jgi:hypothetical protein
LEAFKNSTFVFKAEMPDTFDYDGLFALVVAVISWISSALEGTK